MPSSTPVTLPPTAPRTAPPEAPARRSCILPRSGWSSSRKPATLALTQPARSTTRTGVSGTADPSGIIRVNSRTCRSEVLACRRSSATTARASSRVTSGPGRTSRVAVATARFQSTISAPPMLVMRQPYVDRPSGGPPTKRSRRPRPACRGPSRRPRGRGCSPPGRRRRGVGRRGRRPSRRGSSPRTGCRSWRGAGLRPGSCRSCGPSGFR